MEMRNEVLSRMYFLLFAGILPLACLTAYRTYVLAVEEGEKWKGKGQQANVRFKDLEANRGNILAADGSLLATSIPYFDIFFDPVAPEESDFQSKVDSLALLFHHSLGWTEAPKSIAARLRNLRKSKSNRRLPVIRRISFTRLHEIRTFPLFRLGQFSGGFIVEKSSQRRMPFGLLAQRTVGYLRKDARSVGLESSFDAALRGEPGGQFMLRVNRGKDLWLPMEDLASIHPRDGDDVVTTLDIHYQELTENALLRAMEHHQAEWGTAVVMEVHSGAIKAIANLGLHHGRYSESFNYAIGMAVEPGSTFKTASLLALMENQPIDLSEEVPISYGKASFFGHTLEDVAEESKQLSSISVRRAFEISSNVGMARTLTRYFAAMPGEEGKMPVSDWLQSLKDFQLHLPVQKDIEGEANPYFKEGYSGKDNWSGTTLPWMAIGYELSITPLQLLNFYNAIANDGRMMRPYLVQGVQREGVWVQEFSPSVLRRRIAGPSAIASVQDLLRAVVTRGTAMKLSTPRYVIAGKTGTAQTDYQRLDPREKHKGGYRASFVGYFPAEKPRYSCVVVIHNPSRNGYYGSDVAGPVFREIADKIFFSSPDWQVALNDAPKPVLDKASLPGFDFGATPDIRQVLDYLELPHSGAFDPLWTVLQGSGTALDVKKPDIRQHIVPSVLGAGLKDALFILENKGLKVSVDGVGKVVHQSVRPGTRTKGQTIHLLLR